jgi:hypothetical protein
MLNPRPSVIALALAAAFAIAACGSAASPGPSASPAPTAGATAATPGPTAATPAPAGPLVTIVLRGGDCQGGTCEQTVTIEQSGRVHIAAKPPNDLGVIVPLDLVALQGAIAATNFDLLRTHKFTGTCPTAVDGQELLLTFSTAKGEEVLAACETQLDFAWPVLAALVTVLEPIWPLPHTS